MSKVKAIHLQATMVFSTAVLIEMTPEQSRAVIISFADLIDVCREIELIQAASPRVPAGSAQEGA